MQLRISEGPHSALGIDTAASSEQIRAAFLQLTKQYHPARFGRMSSELQRLSNEIFLGIKGAHDQLQKVVGGPSRGGPIAGQTGSIPIVGDAKTPSTDLLRRTGPIQRPSVGTTPPTDLARGTQRPSTPLSAQRPGSPPPRAGTPQPGTRPSQPLIAQPRTVTPSEITRPGVLPPTAPRQTTPVRAQTPPLGVPRPTTPVSAARPTTPRPSTPSNAPPRPMDFNPGTIRYSGVQPAPKPTGAPAFDERQTLRECLMMLNEKNWADARQALHQLAAKVPQSKNYRALLCYARGREAHAAGKPDEAQLEYQRALQLDPDLDLAKQAIAELARRR